VTAKTLVPPLSDAVFAGKYRGSDQVVKITYSGAGASAHETVAWQVSAACRVGPCDVSLHSLSGKYVVHLAYVGPQYQGLVTRKNWTTCSTDGKSGDANESFSLKVLKAAVLGGRWIATQVSGQIDTQTLGGTACTDASDESFVRVTRVQ
jgi:hypothetical protein